MKLNEKIMVARKRAGLSQIDLADIMGVSRQSVSKWETGEANPEIGKLAQLAAALNVSVDWLLSETDDPVDRVFSKEESREGQSVRSYPDWVENLPGWLERAVKRWGWLFGVYVAGAGALFLFFGIVTRVMQRNFMNTTFSMFPGGESLQEMDVFQMARRNYRIMSAFPIGIGLLLLAVGIILAVKLRKWGQRSSLT